MERTLKKLEDNITTISSDLRLAVHTTLQNSETIEKILSTHERRNEGVVELKMDIVICKKSMKTAQDEIKSIRSLLWKVTGSVVSTLLGIVVYLVIKT